MEKTHDTLTDLHFGTPLWFSLLAWLLPIGIFSQFLSAGPGLFLDPNLLELHGGIGITLSVPVVALLAGALLVRRLRGFGWWAGIVLVFYLIQLGLAVDAVPARLSLHPANGALLLAASIVLLAKVEHRRSQVAAN